ncbi:hypothetical protein PACTADRAFT_48968 [Pachysolen tannophilus NRRL Y-2460]|uniref:Ubiquinol-cytochrome c chaperone domain-containing protein n=1 Tax=Pachysolen tannophilus NRRL Y-2460 TaxID=669874 RepID=A0A1E4TZR1_PACTA|nr:hypothetical protein PACTADRAFT_48968 [Pachysolen tannophilus NRRL Y-2460]
MSMMYLRVSTKKVLRPSVVVGLRSVYGCSIRLNSSHSIKGIKNNNNNNEDIDDFGTPSKLASSSNFPYVEDPTRVNKDIKLKAKIKEEKEESVGFVLPKWKETVGESLISVFGIDMDNIRAGSVGGSKYYYMCKDQGLQFAKEDLSETAKFYYETLQLPKTFSQWFQITSLHIWLLFVRMRAMPFKYGKNYQQKLVDRFFKDMELKLSEEMNVQSGRIIDSYLKDFNDQLKGVVLSYDEGLVTDDATLAAAVWRNLFNGEKEVDLVHVEAVVRYIRMQLYVLDNMSDREFGFGDFEFVKPNEVVTPLTPEQEQVIRQKAKERYERSDGKQLPSMKSKLSLDY